jgi:hypothetical protein
MTCLSRTQSDQAACQDVLDCYETHACGPTTCGTNAQMCGGNTLQISGAAYQYANEVYDCMCP